jgi:adenylate cyclase
MDRIWQHAWDRHGARYSWAFLVISLVVLLPTYLLSSSFVVAMEGSNRYAEAGVITLVATVMLVYVMVLPGVGSSRVVERWAADKAVDDAPALDATYAWVREVVARSVIAGFVGPGLLGAVVGATAGGTAWRLVQYAILGAAIGTAVALIGVHSFAEAALRPARVAIAGDTGIGDSLPRSRPSFAAWTNASMLAAMFAFAVGGATLAAIIDRIREAPVLAVVIGCALTVFFAIPTTVGAVFAPSLRPIRDLAHGTERVAAGDYSQRLPVVQDDDLGALTASFNRMQAGLAERQRLQGAFGTYVDPVLATRLLAQGDDVFTGERREVTVVFVDIRDFTPFAESNSAEDTVARLNALFDIVVPAVVDAGGHVNKFLGDGALAVFGAPNELADHADAAVSAAILIDRLVAERFCGELRIGIGINTGPVIAGTIGGGSNIDR